jgi:hypothetical protein
MSGPDDLIPDHATDPENGEVITDRPFNHARWERLRNEQLGVDVIDPLGHQIGMSSAGRFEPVDGLKHILVGEFDHYGFYDPWYSGAESDHNIHIFPDQPFRFILNDVATAPNFDSAVLSKRQRGQGYCVECEITPGFWNNPYFPTSEPYDSPLIGKTLGAYGPWIHDNGHGGRPEIHPCQFLWWDEGSANPPGIRFRRWFYFSQDGSDRFSRPDHFDGPVQRPWTTSPYRVDITVALQPRVGHYNEYDLQVLYAREIEDMPNADDYYITASLAGQPQPTVIVAKATSHPSEVFTALSRLATDPDERFLRCFLRIGLNIGRDDVHGTGYALLQLSTLQ